MIDVCKALGSWLIGCQLLACSAQSGPEHVGVAVEALSACNETVPANRNIDGFPAYAQCAATQNSAIYSNNGVDTSTTQMGTDWVRTQGSGGYQCTELAHRYLYFKWHVNWTPNGNAGTWCDTMPPSSSGVVQTTTPVHGDLMVLAPGSCGADPSTGHVAVIDLVDPTRLTAVQQNQASRSPYMLSCAKCYLHVVANTGSGSAGAGGAVAAGAGGAGGAGGGMATNIGGAGGKAAPSPVNPTLGTAGTSSPPAPATPSPAAAAPVQTAPPPVAPMPAATNAPAAPPPATMPPYTFSVTPRSSESSASGCGVVRSGRTADAASGSGFVALALAQLCARRRRAVQKT